MFARSLDLGSEELALALEEPRPESSYLAHRENEPGEAEHGTVIVPQGKITKIAVKSGYCMI